METLAGKIVKEILIIQWKKENTLMVYTKKSEKKNLTNMSDWISGLRKSSGYKINCISIK